MIRRAAAAGMLTTAVWAVTNLIVVSAFAQTGGFIQPQQAASNPVRNYGWYAGVALGQSKAPDACRGIPVSCDNTDTGWKILGGYQFTPNIGLEAAYVDLGHASASGVVNGVQVSGKAKATAFELVAIPNLPLGHGISAYGKAGIFRWDGDISVSAVAPGFRVSGSTSDSGTGFTYGAGLRYDFGLNAAMRLEWQRYNDVGNLSTIKTDVDLMSLAFIWKF